MCCDGVNELCAALLSRMHGTSADATSLAEATLLACAIQARNECAAACSHSNWQLQATVTPSISCGV
jgi:hypothetical protein